jgi:predicted transcriptional regulator
MTRQLQDAIARAEQLPEADQADLAEVVRAFIAARKAEPVPLTADEEAAIEEGLAQAERGEFASDEEVNALLNRPWA